MFVSAVVYLGLIVAFAGSIAVVKPMPRTGLRTRLHGAGTVAAGLALTAVGFLLPAPERRIAHAGSKLDEVFPVWQFNEIHTIRIAASPARVFEAIELVRADEIALFQTLTWIRRGGRELPESILNAGRRKPLIDVAVLGGFVRLADEPPRELVLGAVVLAPRGTRGVLTPAVFRKQFPPGFALAAMNFLVVPDGAGGSVVSTETRVLATSDSARRRFAAYWRVIYPGSAIIRRMWLRAIERRATARNRIDAELESGARQKS